MSHVTHVVMAAYSSSTSRSDESCSSARECSSDSDKVASLMDMLKTPTPSDLIVYLH